jgi:hypothetical protein
MAAIALGASRLSIPNMMGSDMDPSALGPRDFRKKLSAECFESRVVSAVSFVLYSIPQCRVHPVRGKGRSHLISLAVPNINLTSARHSGQRGNKKEE